jgi:hypothetical protein
MAEILGVSKQRADRLCCVASGPGEVDRYARQVSDHQGQFGERVGKSSGRRSVGAEIVEPPAEVLNEGMACDDDPGGSVTFQPSHRSKPGLEASMVGLDGVVRVDLCVMEGGRHQLVEDSGGRRGCGRS